MLFTKVHYNETRFGMDFITEKVHKLYWEDDFNCARTMLICLGELFHLKYDTQLLDSAVGLHGAGGFRAQCGLVEGGLMFIGVYFGQLGKDEKIIVTICYDFAELFSKKFGSLQCFDLRPNGFTVADPPHMCERITCEAVAFAYDFVRNKIS